MKINLLYRDKKTIGGTRRLMRFPFLRNEVNGTRISGKKCAMHWWQGATAARRLKHTYRKRNAFLRDCKGTKSINDATVQKYALALLEKGLSHAYVNQAISALNFYFRHVLKQPKSAAYVRPKKESKLPDVLSLNEVMRLLKAAKNPKHKAILYLTYTSGLRVSEVVRLRLEDCDRERKVLKVRQGKGRKDRQTLLSEEAFAVVEQYDRGNSQQTGCFQGRGKAAT